MTGIPEQALVAAEGCLGHYSPEVKDALARGYSEAGYRGAMRRVADLLATGVSGMYVPRSTSSPRTCMPARKTWPWNGCRRPSRRVTRMCTGPSETRSRMTALVTTRDFGISCGARDFPSESTPGANLSLMKLFAMPQRAPSMTQSGSNSGFQLGTCGPLYCIASTASDVG